MHESNTRVRLRWIDGLRGAACIIVFLGHSIACIFPAVYFGKTYSAHSELEYWLHNSPLNILFNASSMVTLFFLISGYLLVNNDYKRKQSLLKVFLYRYIRYWPMVTIGIIISAIVMHMEMVYSMELADYSFANNYVSLYNNFQPRIFGKDGIIFEIFIKVFLIGSDYNNILWFVSVEFIGGGICEFIIRLCKNIRVQKVVFAILFIVSSLVGMKVWKLQFFSAMCLGCFLCSSKNFKKRRTCKIEFLLGVIFLMFPQQNPDGIFFF